MIRKYRPHPSSSFNLSAKLAVVNSWDTGLDDQIGWSADSRDANTLDNFTPSEQNMSGEEKAKLHEPKRRSRHYAWTASGCQNPGMPSHRPRAAGCPAHTGPR